MPTYEYRCEQGHTFEVVRRMSDAPLAQCTTCSAPVEQVFHPVAVHFKGKGFYNTDYGTKNRARETQDSKDSGVGEVKKQDGTATNGSGEAKSEAKPSETKSVANGTTKATETKSAPAPKKSADS